MKVQTIKKLQAVAFFAQNQKNQMELSIRTMKMSGNLDDLKLAETMVENYQNVITTIDEVIADEQIAPGVSKGNTEEENKLLSEDSSDGNAVSGDSDVGVLQPGLPVR